MRGRVASLLLVLTVAACRAPGTSAPVHATSRSAAPSTGPTAAATAIASTSSAAPVASAGPIASTAPRPSAGAPAGVALKPPTQPYHTLTGAIQLVAKGLVSGGGSIVANNGGAVVVPTAASLISDKGGSVLVGAGGNVIAAASGNFIPPDAGQGGMAATTAGGYLVAAGGIIANNTGNLVANNAGNLIANNGGGLTGKTKYHLDATDGTARVPTAGMLVSAVSLATHEYLPVGVDGAGKPVYSVYSNLQGQYQLYLPADTAGNVVVVASAPQVQSEAQVTNAFTPAVATDAVPLDEDTALATRHVRRLFVDYMAALLTKNEAEDTVADLVAATPALGTLIEKLLAVLSVRAAANHVPTGPGADRIPEVQELAQWMTDAALAQVDASTLRTNQLASPNWPGPAEQPYQALGDAFKTIRERTSVYLSKHGGGGTPSLAFVLDQRASRNENTPACAHAMTLPIEDAGTLVTYIESQILQPRYAHPMANGTRALHALSDVLIDPAAPPSPNDPAAYLPAGGGAPLFIMDRIDACQLAVMSALVLTLTPPDWPGGEPLPASTKAVFDRLDAYCTTHTFSAAPAPDPSPVCDAPATP